MLTDRHWIAVGSAAGVVTALFTAAMAIAVIATAIYARRTLHATRDDSRARTRPMLAAYLERELLASGTILLVIKNFGKSAATDVDVAFDPPSPPVDQVDAMPDSEMKKWLYGRFAEPVPVWVPGWSTNNVVRSRSAAAEELAPFTVVLSYTGPDGTRYADERFLLSPPSILKETTSDPSKTTDPIVLAQQGIAALQALVRTIRNR